MKPDYPYAAAFSKLKKIMLPYGKTLVCEKDDAAEYVVYTTHIMKNKKPLFFGAVQKRKNYVSYHLMPVYVFPELLDNLSQELKQRMHGKSCFNFKSVDREQLDELEALTATGYERYKDSNYV